MSYPGLTKRTAYGISAQQANIQGVLCNRGHAGLWGELNLGRKSKSRYCRGCSDIHARRRNYGISHDQYLSMIEKQDGRCAACNGKEKLVVDHNHDTGEVRGLLCSRCNYVAGSIESNNFNDVVDYLSRFQKMAATGRKRAK